MHKHLKDGRQTTRGPSRFSRGLSRFSRRENGTVPLPNRVFFRPPLARLIRVFAAALGIGLPLLSVAATAADVEPLRREIFVPFEDLNALLESQPRRVLLSRGEYEALLKKAKKTPETPASRAAALVSADYVSSIGQGRAQATGTLVVDVLEGGLHAVPLDLSGVGLRHAVLDDRPAAIGRTEQGRLMLFVEGAGRHRLLLEMVAPVETTAAQQVLRFRLPHPPAVRFRLTVPGDVEVKSGAHVVSRVVDDRAGVTRFELLLPQRGAPLVMTLNSRLQRRRRALTARSVLVDEVTQAYERLQAAVSFGILSGAVDRFRFVVPQGFDVTEVSSPRLARWAMETDDSKRVLEVRLRERTTETVVLNLSAVSVPPQLDEWTFPKLEPLGVVSHAAVLGVLAEKRLKLESVATESLIPIDTAVLRQATGGNGLSRGAGSAPPLRPVVAYYAPRAAFDLSARFLAPQAETDVVTNVLLTVKQENLQARGQFQLTPEVEKLFGVDFSVPAAWHVTAVTTADGKPIAFERYGPKDAPGRIRVRLPSGVAPGDSYPVCFTAESTPHGWLDDWQSRRFEFPVFTVAGAARDVGAIAVEVRDDLTVRPGTLQRLTPLDDAEKKQYGLSTSHTTLVWRYESRPYTAELVAERTRPRLSARTFSFLKIQPEGLTAHYEIVYQVRQARCRRLALLLPEDTPSALSIRGLDGVGLKEYASRSADGLRRWDVLLEEPRVGAVRLAVDFQQPLAEQEPRGYALPLVAADGVAYQSGQVAVEASPELEVRVDTPARPVDVGELVDADYRPGRGLLGVFGFLGDPPAVSVDVFRHPGYRLDPVIVQRAELTTLLSVDGVSQTAARFELRSRALYVQVQLPPGAELWSVDLDGQPIKPQRKGESLLVGLPAATAPTVRTLRLVYEDAIDPVALAGQIDVPAPKLLLPGEREGPPVEVPTADLIWYLHLPTGYEVTASEGTVVTRVDRPRPAVVNVAEAVASLLLFSSAMPAEARKPRAKDDSGKAEAEAAAKPQAPSDQPAAGPERELHELIPPAAAEPVSGLLPTETEAASARQAPEPRKPQKKPSPAARRLEGFSSLKIELASLADRTHGVVTFRSLGADPRLQVTLANRTRFDTLGWTLALAVGLVGLAMTRRTVRTKVRFLLAVILLGTLVPLIPGMGEAAVPANMAVYAASLLVPYYLLAGCVKWLAVLFRFKPNARRAAVATTAGLLLAAICVPAANAAEPPAARGPYVIQVVGPPEPVNVPDSAIILPYDPASATGIRDVDRMLVPYAKYVELWNRAYPDRKLEAKPPPAPYAMAGASYRTTLEGDEYLLVEGQLEIDVFTDEPVAVPLGLEGGVLTTAALDGRPARLSVPRALGTEAPVMAQQAAQQAEPQRANQPAGQQSPPHPFLVLHVAGEGRHRLRLAVRVRLERRGGWRVAGGVLPTAPAAELVLRVPQPQTEVRLGHVLDRRAVETLAADQEIETAIGAGGAISIQWRPKVTEGQVDRSLTVRSRATLDVQEDGLRLAWQLEFEFPRSQRDEFSVQVPAGYLVEKVEGANVRGWEVHGQGGRPSVTVSLLNTARDRERFTLHLWRGDAGGQGESAEFDVPVVTVGDAALDSGELTIRRSPLLDLRAVSTSGVTRTDPESGDSAALDRSGVGRREESPLPLRPFQAYRFVTTPFSIRLAAAPVVAGVTANVETLLKIAEYQRTLESRLNLDVRRRPIYRVRAFLPESLEVEHVSAPGDFQWAVTRRDGRPLLTVHLATGQQGRVAVILRGKLTAAGPTDPLPLPRLEVLDAGRQQGDIAVQADPAFDVRSEGLENCRSVLLDRVAEWLDARQRQAARLALHYSRPDYRGTLRLAYRQPRVRGDTITNVRVTDRAVEETILLDFDVQNAGIRELSFLLPATMKNARIRVPMLRQKTVEPAGAGPDAPIRVRLQLQDEVMEKLRVLVENDRLLTSKPQSAPIPVLETAGRPGTWAVGRRFVTLESAGRDEVVIQKADGLEKLSRQQAEWRSLQGMLSGSITRAYLVRDDAESPELRFALRQRATLKMAGARIGLAEANLVLDSSGAYRAEQIYHLDNATEQYLQIKLPRGARLWTARVAGEPVKPTQDPDATDVRFVRVPLVKTAPGDMDYAVVLKYGGQMPPLGRIDKVRFPLIETVKLRAELSQVRLFLPETHAWFDFGGTMSRVTEEGDLTAGYLSYQTKVAERLMKTAERAGEFAQVRAANNLKNLAIQLHSYHEASRGEYGNVRLQAEFDKNAAVLRGAKQQIEQLEQRTEERIEEDNRNRLNDLYAGQKVDRARNVVQGLGYNFDETVNRQTPAGSTSQSRFNAEWLEKSRLGNKEVIISSEAKKRPAPASGKPGLRKAQQAEAPPLAPFKARVFQQDKDGEKAGARGASRLGTGTEQGGAGGRFSERRRDVVSRYQEEQRAAQVLGRRAAPGGVDELNAPVGGEFAGQAAAAGPPAGLASLDVELPRRGLVYRFTTPGGDVEITARTAGGPMVRGCLEAAIALVVIALILWMIGQAKQGRFAWITGRIGSAVMICLGLAALWLLPFLGLLLVAAGIMAIVRRAVARRAAPAT